MNQDNKEFELSGTLGSLSDTALNNLANTTAPEPVINNDNNAVQNENNTEIEMLDVPAVENSINIDNSKEVLTESNTLEKETELNNTFAMPTAPTLDANPTNFDIGDIGSVPPVDPKSKSEKKKTKKKNTIFAILVIIFVLAIGALIYYYLHISKGSLANAVEVKNITLELGDNLPSDINEYATFKAVSGSNCVLNTKKIDTSKAGTYEFTITCGNNQYKGNVILKDTRAPEVKTKTIVKKINEEIKPEEFIAECNESSNCKYEFETPDAITSNMATAGNYDINIIVKDANNNSSTAKAKLIVIDSDIKVYLNCVLSDQTIEGFNGTVTYTDKVGIRPDLQYAGIYFKNKLYLAKTEEEYNTIKDEYTNGTLKINNGEGNPVFDDTNLTISFEEVLSGELEAGKDFASIKSNYETQKNYKCNIINVN